MALSDLVDSRKDSANIVADADIRSTPNHQP